MSMLRALAMHYDRLLAKGAAPDFGYSREAVSFAIVLAPSGDVIDVTDLRDTSGKQPRPSRHAVPRAVNRSVNVVPNFLWDKTAYALGATGDPETGSAVLCRRGEGDSFIRLHNELLSRTDDEGLQALMAFLAGWRADRYETLPSAEDMLDTNVVFRLDGQLEFIHERPAAHRIWQQNLARQGADERLCLVTGESAQTARLHPKIKGVRGAQSSGASIVAFNQDAFCSFGKKQGNNAPVSEQTAFAYTTALNLLLARNSGRSIRIGDATTVFWAHAASGEESASAAEDLFSILADPPRSGAKEAVEISDKLAAVAEGRALKDVDPDLDEGTRFFVLGLSPNASRLSVRFWHEDSIGALAQRIVEHWHDLRIDPSPWKIAPPVWRLLIETAAHRKGENIPPTLGGALMRTILTGSRYPHSLLGAVIARMRADKDINGHRVAICKACLARDHRLGFEYEEVPMSLDRDADHPAYLLGRLFAVYEGVQRAALGQVNATIKDRYFGAASATPASVFPLLERGSAAHLASLRKGDKGGRAHWFDQEIDEILSKMDAAFPRSLRLEDQGRFAIGYHHQRNSGRSAAGDRNRNTDHHGEDQA